jgi:hypothetical protein
MRKYKEEGGIMKRRKKDEMKERRKRINQSFYTLQSPPSSLTGFAIAFLCE